MPAFKLSGEDQMLRFVNQFKLAAGHFYKGEFVKRMAEDLLMLCIRPPPRGCPVKTGDLRDSHRIAEQSIDNIIIEATMYYASWVHEGHFNALTGGWVPANEWMDRAIADWEPYLQKRLDEAIKQIEGATGLAALSTTPGLAGAVAGGLIGIRKRLFG